MHRHDNDLIMALAEGSLDGPDAAAAAESIAACAQCSEELALQRQALAALASLTPTHLTDLEAARLRRDLDAALGHSRTAAPAAPSRRRLSLKPLVGIAAALLAVVVAVPVLQSLGGGDDSAELSTAADVSREAGEDASTDDVAGAGLASVTTAAPAATEESPAQADASDGGDSELMMASTITGTENAASPEAIRSDLAAYQEELATALEQDGDVAPEIDLALAVLGERYVVVDADAALDCASGLGFEGAAGDVVALGELELTDTGERLVIEIHPTDAGPVVVALDAGTCEVIAISGP